LEHKALRLEVEKDDVEVLLEEEREKVAEQSEMIAKLEKEVLQSKRKISKLEAEILGYQKSVETKRKKLRKYAEGAKKILLAMKEVPFNDCDDEHTSDSSEE
jgi:molecular chaperone GrpE (heat shock protein)